MLDYNLEKRRFVIGGVAIAIVVIYMIRLFTLQIMSDDYKKNADSNAFLKRIEFPARGAIYDRNGKLLVYNQPSYDLMVVMNEESGRLDTMDFCNSLGITKDFFIKRMNDIKDRSKNPGYSRYTQQLFMGQLSDRDFSVFQEKMFRFPGFYVQKRTVREYTYPYAAHVLGDVGEVSQSDIEDDDYYQAGDYIGKLGIEKFYEKQLRGEKGVKIMLRDAHGRIQGSYQNGKLDQKPVAGKDLTLGLDVKLQALGERLLQGKIGRIEESDTSQRKDGDEEVIPEPGSQSLINQESNEHSTQEELDPHNVERNDIGRKEHEEQRNAYRIGKDHQCLFPIARIGVHHASRKNLHQQKHDKLTHRSIGIPHHHVLILHTHYEVSHHRHTGKENGTRHTFAVKHEEE